MSKITGYEFPSSFDKSDKYRVELHEYDDNWFGYQKVIRISNGNDISSEIVIECPLVIDKMIQYLSELREKMN